MRSFILSTVVLLAFSSCDLLNKEGSEIVDEAATQWAEAYFNYQFDRASKYVTPESRKWIRFAASNLSEQDIDLLRQQENMAAVSLLDCELADDSTWIATIEVSNYVKTDSLNLVGHLVDNDTKFQIKIVERDKRMYVKMEGLPQSGMHNRD